MTNKLIMMQLERYLFIQLHFKLKSFQVRDVYMGLLWRHLKGTYVESHEVRHAYESINQVMIKLCPSHHLLLTYTGYHVCW